MVINQHVRSNQSNYMSVGRSKTNLRVLKIIHSKDDVLSAFKKLMLVNHPDKGKEVYSSKNYTSFKETLIKSL